MTVKVTARGAERWKQGHPWIYRSDVAEEPDKKPGIVPVTDRKGKFLGQALYSPSSEIRLRLLTRGTEPIDYCPLHNHPFDAVATSGDTATRPAVAATSGEVTQPALAPVDHLHDASGPSGDAHLGDNTPPAVASGATPATALPSSAPRKRGFWGRIFGR